MEHPRTYDVELDTPRKLAFVDRGEVIAVLNPDGSATVPKGIRVRDALARVLRIVRGDQSPPSLPVPHSLTLRDCVQLAYLSYTDVSNYERLALRWDDAAREFVIDYEAAGTGFVRRNLRLGRGWGTVTPAPSLCQRIANAFWRVFGRRV